MQNDLLIKLTRIANEVRVKMSKLKKNADGGTIPGFCEGTSSLSKPSSHESQEDLKGRDPSNIEVHRLTQKPNLAWDILKRNIQVTPLKALPYDTHQPENCLRFVCLSDTHSKVEKRDFCNTVPDGDVLLHAGDFTLHSTVEEYIAFDKFLGQLPHHIKFVIPGNHEMLLDPQFSSMRHYEFRKNLKLSSKPADEEAEIRVVKSLLSNATVLIDSLVEMCGIKIYGTPWVPQYGYPAFGCHRGEQLLEKHKKIPNHVDILMSHGPPLGFGDITLSQKHVGCVELLNTVRHRVKPKYVISGHIHEGHGVSTDGTTVYINAAVCTKGYKPTQKPVIFDYPIPEPYTLDDFLKLTQSDFDIDSI